MDVNQSGGLYVSYGKADAARYIKNLGPTPISKLLGVAGETVQHISVKDALKVPSNEQTAKETAKLLLSNEKLLQSFNDSFYSLATTGDVDKSISKEELKRAFESPESKEAQKYHMESVHFLGIVNMPMSLNWFMNILETKVMMRFRMSMIN